MWVAPWVSSATFEIPWAATGDVESVVVPSAKIPWKFHPQHFTVASVRMTHTDLAPTDSVAAFVMPCTVTGVLRLVLVPSPSCPFVFWPQHFTVPPEMSAQLKYSPDPI